MGSAQYEPDRELTPTAVFPDVRATDPDNVFPHGSANESLSLDGLQWLVDGEPINNVWGDGTYEIDTSTSDTRGLLRIKKNIPASERVTLKFKGKFLDWRTGIIYQIESDEMALTCTDKGNDIFSCSVDKPNGEYNTLYDQLLLYDYKKARGLVTTGSREDYLDGGYEYTINTLLTKGMTPYDTLPDGITMKVTNLADSKEVSEDNEGVILIEYPIIKLDLRMLDNVNFKVEFTKGDTLLASTAFGVHKKTSLPTYGKPLRGADIRPQQQVYENSCVLNADTGKLDYPECFYLITWHTQATVIDNDVSKFGDEKSWQQGEKMLVNVDELGIGHTYNNSCFDVYFDVEPHKTLHSLTDGDNVLTDENEEVLIG